MHQFDLKNRTAVITGGAQGFGFDIAKRFLSSGAKVIIWDIDKNELQEASKKLNSSNLLAISKHLFLFTKDANFLSNEPSFSSG